MNKKLLLSASATVVAVSLMTCAPAYADTIPSTGGAHVSLNNTGLTINLNGTTTTSGSGSGTSTNSGVNISLDNNGLNVNLNGKTTTTTTTTNNPTSTNTGVNTNTNTTTSTNTNTNTSTSTSTNANTTSGNGSTSSNNGTSTTSDSGSTSGTTATTTTTDTSTTTTDMPLDQVALSASATKVYPAKDGYMDSVKFSIKGLNANSSSVGVTGKAVLSRAGKTVKTWNITKATTNLTWNGRIGNKLKAGSYVLKVTAKSADGTVKTASTKIQVLADHLKKATVTVKSTVGATDTKAMMPKAVAKAFSKGKVSIRIRTVAVVVGHAKLVFANHGVKRTLNLKNGTHTTKALSVPKGFKQVKIHHDWKKGTTKLLSVKAIWSYSKLVK